MTDAICKLPDLLINQIAAGEVVENPASCIKELIENSLDAKATNIQISIKSGGYVSILIVDNGHGIAKDQVLIAFERHTTSKIRQLEDLQIHHKMGFRGEALASISSCSKVTLKTSQEDGSGIIAELEGGECKRFEDAALKKGTSIEIKELFYNTPARKKFQKSCGISTSEIERLIMTMILAHPKVSFKLKSDDQVLIDAPIDHALDFKKAFKKRIFDTFTNFQVDKGSFVDIHDPICSIIGYLAPFDAHSHNRKNQFFIINNRPVEAPTLSYTLGEVLKTYLPEKRFFQGVFHIQIDPKWVDINVHPQKKEVKFAEEAYVKDLLKRLVMPKTPVFPDFKKPELLKESIPYDFSLPPKQERVENTTFVPSYTYTKTIGFYPPYLLIDSNELSSFFEKKGLVLFDVQKAFFQNSLHEFLKSGSPFPSQGLLLPEALNLSVHEKHLAITEKPLLEKFGLLIDHEACLVAYPSGISLETSKKLATMILSMHQGSLKEIASMFFELIGKETRFSYEEAHRLLNKASCQDQHFQSCFCLITDNKLKELFYDLCES